MEPQASRGPEGGRLLGGAARSGALALAGLALWLVGCCAQPEPDAAARPAGRKEPPAKLATPTPASAPAPTAAPGAPNPTVQLTILHTNDWHGYAFPDRSHKTGKLYGGVLACRAAVSRIRRVAPDRVLVLDAGDCLTGHPCASFVDDGIKGQAFLDLWRLVGYDAWEIGNHDLDAGRANLRGLLGKVPVPALCANWVLAGPEPLPGRGRPLPVEPFLVFRRGGLRIAVIGLLTTDLKTLASQQTMAGTEIADPVACLQAWWPTLERLSDVQIALTHQGIEEDERLARSAPGLEAIIGGHSHTRLNAPRVIGGVPICQTGGHGRRLGRLDLTMRGKKRVAFAGRLLPVLSEPGPDSAELVARAAALRARTDRLAKEVLGQVPAALGRSYHAQSPLGGAVAEAVRRAAKADVGAINAGGVRADLDAGAVTRGELLEILPFGSSIVRVRLSGAQLLEVLRYNARASYQEAHGILQLAGCAVYAQGLRGGEVRVLSATVAGAPIEPTRTYTLATSTYVVEQAAKYLGIPVPDDGRAELPAIVRAAVERQVRAGSFGPPVHGATKITKASQPASQR